MPFIVFRYWLADWAAYEMHNALYTLLIYYYCIVLVLFSVKL